MKYMNILIVLFILHSSAYAIDLFHKDDLFSGGLVLKVFDLSVITGSNAFDHEPMIAYGLKTNYLQRDHYRIGAQIFKGIQYTREDSNFDMIFGGINYQLKLNRRKDKNVLLGAVFGMGRYLINDPSFNEQKGNFLFWEPTLDLELFRINNFYMELNFSYLQSFNSRFDISGFSAGGAFMFSHKY